MTNDTVQPSVSGNNPHSFGTLLKTTREAQGLERKDICSQLRLNENIINMLETDDYRSDLPATFIRGYIRSYGKLLQVPEHEILKALERIHPTPVKQDVTPVALRNESAATVTSSNYLVQFFTYLIILTMVGLVGTWWYKHNSNNSDNQQTTPNSLNGPLAPPTLNDKPAIPASISTVPLSTTQNNGLIPTTPSIPSAATQAAPPSHADEVLSNKPAIQTNASINNANSTNNTNPISTTSSSSNSTTDASSSPSAADTTDDAQ